MLSASSSTSVVQANSISITPKQEDVDVTSHALNHFFEAFQGSLLLTASSNKTGIVRGVYTLGIYSNHTDLGCP